MKNKIICFIKFSLMNKAFYLMLLLSAFWFNTKAQSGTNDPTFNPTDIGFGFGDGANNRIRTTAIQSDGKIIIGGDFTSYNGIAKKYFTRLNADGTLDPTFNYGTGPNSWVLATAIQSDGKIIIAGDFTSYNGTARNRIARINVDGTLDVTFNPGAGANNSVLSISIQSDGKIIIGGYFTFYIGTTINRIARINVDGTLDATFNPGAGTNNPVFTTAIQNDGKIIIGGNFNSYNGVTKNYIARINVDGTLDATFNSGAGPSNSVYTTAIQSDGKIIIGGEFYTYNGATRNFIARLNTDGTLDATFNPGTGADYTVMVVAIQNDGKIIIGGDFDSYNGTIRGRIARLNTDGTLDANFNIVLGASNSVLSIAIQSDGKIIIGGAFTFYNGAASTFYNATVRNCIAKLNTDGTIDFTFNPSFGANNSVATTAIQNDGKIIIGGSFTSYNETFRNHIARLNADGTLDATFNPGTGASSEVRTTAIQSDGKIIIGGAFFSYNYISINRIARLKADGTLDVTFKLGTGADGTVFTTAIQSDGKIIIGGDFTSFNGTARNHIARLNSDGTLDATFNPGSGADGTVFTTAIQSDGKIIIGGDFASYNGTTKNHIARLYADGTLDATFNNGTGVNGTVFTTAIQSDGEIIIGGVFNSYNGITRSQIARLNANGTLDANFNIGTGTDSIVSTTAIQSDGKIIIGGSFTSFNGTVRNRIARLNSDGTLDATFNPGMGASSYVWTTAIQSDGKIIIGGNFTSYNGIGRNRVARILNSNPLGITTLQSASISIYPNPVSDELHIEIEGNNEQVNMEILNSIGQVVYKGNLAKAITVQTSDFVRGVYLIKLGNDKMFDVKKMIKE